MNRRDPVDADLATMIREVRFSPVRLREGYDMGEVDYLLDRLLDAVGRDDDIVEILDHVALSEVRLREGYDIAEVNEFLEQVRIKVAVAQEFEPAPGPDPGFLEVQAPPPAPPQPAAPPTVIVEHRGFFARLFRKR